MKPQPHLLFRSLATSSILLTLACTAPGSTVPAKPAEPFKPMLKLRPVTVSLLAGATQPFQVEINYPEGVRYLRQPVGWRVVEPQGGTINGVGLYTAPSAPGVFHVEVRREDFPELSATATVTVR